MPILRALSAPLVGGLLLIAILTAIWMIDRQSSQLEKVAATLESMKAEKAEPEELALLGQAKWHSRSDVEKQFAALGATPSATSLAQKITEVDDWLIEPKSAAAVQELLNNRLDQLRQRVVSEVKEKHGLALSANKGADAVKVFNDAGALIAIFPMGDSPVIVETARWLNASHRNIGLKIEVAKRVRYNHWAVVRIDQAIQDYHAKSGFLNSKKENLAMIDSLAAYLGAIDPNQLEPTVLTLYNYVIEMTKGSISEADKVSLAKKLTAADIRRSHPDDF